MTKGFQVSGFRFEIWDLTRNLIFAENSAIKQNWIKRDKTISTHSGYIAGLAFRSTREFLLSGSYDGTVALSGLGTRTKGHMFQLKVPVKAIAFGESDKTILAFTDDKIVHIWDEKTYKIICEFPVLGSREKYTHGTLGSKYITSAEFSPDGKYILLGCQDKIVYVIPLIPKAKAHRLIGHTIAGITVGWINNDLVFSAAQTDDRLTIWDWHTRRKILEIPGSGTLSPVAVHGSTIASGHGVSRKIYLWDRTNGSLRSTMSIPFFSSEFISSICFHPDGLHLCAGLSQGSIRLWSLDHTGHQTLKDAHRGAIHKIAFSADGSLLASSDLKTNVIRIWNLAG
jgi:WD40 repeat protein